MQRVHYFQRFSKVEDVATNNTLLLLNRIQHHDPRIFQEVLQQLLSTEELTIGAELTQQVTTKNSIVDGVIRQRGFHVVLETKCHATFHVSQLKSHLDAFAASTADLQVLLLLGKQEPVDLNSAQAAVAEFNRSHRRNVAVAWTTFAHLTETCRDIVPEHERETIELIDDYENFCADEGLLASSDADLLVVGCSRSMADNLALSLYYDRKKAHRPAKFIGFYHDKAVRAIGLLDCVVRAELDGSSLKTTDSIELLAEQSDRIREAMARAPRNGWDITRDHYFFLAGDIQETNFRKLTKYPMWSRRYFDLRELLGIGGKGRLPDLSSVAKGLRDVTW